MTVLEKTLKTIKKKQVLATFMREFVPNGTEWGFLRDYNEYCFLIDRVSTDGLYDGIFIFQRPQLTRVRWGSTLLRSTTELYKRKNKKISRPKISIDNMKSALKDIQKAYGYVCVSIDDLDSEALIIGEIESLDDTHMLLYEFSGKTAKDRSHLLVPLAEITSLEAGGIFEEDLRHLNFEYWAKTPKPKKT